MAEPALNNLVEWTVSELSSALKRTVEDAYGYVRVRGEVSGFKGASAVRPCYFRLKDDKAVLEAVIWKGTFGRMRVKPEEGLDVIVSGQAHDLRRLVQIPDRDRHASSLPASAR